MKIRFLRSPRTQATAVLILSILLGVGTYLYLVSYQSGMEARNELTPVLVAKSEIPLGTSYGEIMNNGLFEIKNLPQGAIPSNAVLPNSAVNESLKTKGPLLPGQIMVSSFFASGVRQDVGLAIPRGMLAVTVAIDDVSRVGNFVLPGSRVVIFTTTSTNSGNSTTSVLLPDVLVIGIGDETDVNLTTATPISSPLVTVALPAGDAKRLILASKSAQLTLALAHANDPLTVIRDAQESDDASPTGN